MKRKLAEDLIHTNREYTKLKSERPEDAIPREVPPRQMPGHRGLRRPELERWTTAELRQAAETLDISEPAAMTRETLRYYMPSPGMLADSIQSRAAISSPVARDADP